MRAIRQPRAEVAILGAVEAPDACDNPDLGLRLVWVGRLCLGSGERNRRRGHPRHVKIGPGSQEVGVLKVSFAQLGPANDSHRCGARL